MNPMLLDTNLKITPSNAASKLDAIVDAIIQDLKNGLRVAQHAEALRAYGAEATARLIHHLRTDEAAVSVALFALQQCWSPLAREPVAAILKSADESQRKLATVLLVNNEGYAALIDACAPLADHPDPAIAGFSLERAEAESPDLARITRALARKELWSCVWKYLPRYYSPTLTPATRAILEHGSADAPLGALVSLIHQNDRSAETRARMSGFLQNEHANVRELAGEYLLWHGHEPHRAALSAAMQKESDVYARGSIEAALAALDRRKKSPSLPDTLTLSAPLSYAEALTRLRSKDTPESRAEAFALYAWKEPFEPHCAYRGQTLSNAFLAERQARLQLQATLFSVPINMFAEQTVFRGAFSAPEATTLIAPVRTFFDPARQSYAKDMKDSKDGFGGMVHIGDDILWNREHRSVVSIGNGLVRQVSCTPTWGTVIVVEHTLPFAQKVCSLYAHLSPFICVRPGEVVTQGQKLGAIGRSFAYENGGYLSHLHFGIHEGPYGLLPHPGGMADVRWQGVQYRGKVLDANPEETGIEIFTPRGVYHVRKPTTWVSGYISKRAWDEGQHGWCDPQKFIREHLNP